ncbi:hypothetical protein AS029_02645 [Microbacterium enclense]|nr:hypothetical protein AS029_02645 [Microbacterium enclense]
MHGGQDCLVCAAVNLEPPTQLAIAFRIRGEVDLASLADFQEAGPAPTDRSTHKIGLSGLCSQHPHAIRPQIFLEQPEFRCPIGVDALVHVKMVTLKPRRHRGVDVYALEEPVR